MPKCPEHAGIRGPRPRDCPACAAALPPRRKSIGPPRVPKCPKHAGQPGRRRLNCPACQELVRKYGLTSREQEPEWDPRPAIELPEAADVAAPILPLAGHHQWRPPRTGDPPTCGKTFTLVDGGELRCRKRGPHRCEPRAAKTIAFFEELLVHIKGPYARKPFLLREWQKEDIIRPIFGEVVWSEEWECYVRRYRIAIVCLGRKNGKSELLAGAALYLMIGDEEDASEVYGAARDTKQAGKVFEPAQRMAMLSPVLRRRIKYNKNARRLYDLDSASYYEVISSDAPAQLGHNPHGFILDEAISQRDDSLWNAMRTAAGARTQMLTLCITTETDDDTGFAAGLINEAERIQEDPRRAPHIFAYVRKLPSSEQGLDHLRELFPNSPDLPVSCDPFDERNWRWGNPALGDFLSMQALREEAIEAHNESRKENAFRQFRMNQRVQQQTREISLRVWDNCIGEAISDPEKIAAKLGGQRCWGGLDLSATSDLTAWCLLFENGWATWRLWCPESMVPMLNEHTGSLFGVWAREGWISLTEGDTIDYDQVYAGIVDDWKRYRIMSVAYDRWGGEAARQELKKRIGLELEVTDSTYQRMTAPMAELKRILKAGEFSHGGNPAMRWQADNLEGRSPTDDPDKRRPVKPDRHQSGKRIDGMLSLYFAIDMRMRDLQDDYAVLDSVR